MNTNTHPEPGQGSNLPAGTPANLPQYWHIDPLGGERTLRPSVILPRAKRSPFKRTGKSARRSGFALWEMLNWLAAACIVWALFGAVVFGIFYYGSR